MRLKPLLLFLSTWLGMHAAHAQTLLRQESFETDGEGSRYTSTAFDRRNEPVPVRGQYFLRENNPVQTASGTQTFGTGASPSVIGNVAGTAPTVPVTPVPGSYPAGSFFWASEGATGQTESPPVPRRPGQTVTLNPVSIASYTALQVQVAFADARGPGAPLAAPQWENDDFIRVQVRINGTGSWITIGQFVGDATAGGNLRLDTNRDGVSSAAEGGTVLTPTLTDFTFNYNGSGTTLEARVEVDQYSATEELAFDNIRVIGTLSATAGPVLANLETTDLSYNEGDAAKIITSTLTVGDSDSPNLTGATVSLTTGFVAAQDQLWFTNQNGISGSYNTGSGVLTLTGTASLAAYQAALRSVRYQNTETVTAIGGLRVATFVVTDGTNTSNAVSRNINVVAVLNPPAPLPYTEDFTESDGEGLRYASNTWSTATAAPCFGFLRTNVNPYSCTPTTFTNISNSYYWYAEGTTSAVNPNSVDIGTLVLAPVNATNYGNLHFNVRMATGQSAQWDTEDYVKFFYRTSSTAPWTAFAAFYGNVGPPTTIPTGELQRDTDLNGSPDGAIVLNAMLQNFDLALPANVTGAAVSFMIEVSNDGQEELAFDRIQITGTLNNPPAISAQSRTVNENAANGTNVGAVITASEPDGQTLTYAITAGNTGGAFAINASTGQITVANSAALDFETTPSFALTVQVTDNGTPAAGSSATVTVNLNNLDEVPPTVSISSSTGANGGNTSTSPIPFTITFSENVTTFVQGDVTVAGGSISDFTGSGTTYTFNLIPTGNGTKTVNVPAAVAFDAAGNANTAATQFSITYTAPNTTVVSVTRLTPSPTATAQVRYRVVFAASVTGVTVGNFSVTTPTGNITGASVSSAVGSGTTYTVTVNTGTGDGTLRLNVANSGSISPMVTGLPYTAGEVYTITKSFAAQPRLVLRGAGSGSGDYGDVTAFVDQVQVLQGGTAFAGGLTNGGFETNNVAANDFRYATSVVASPWSFTGNSGVSRNGSGFGSTAPTGGGDAVGLLQGTGASIAQSLAIPTGTYQVNFLTTQRTNQFSDQVVNVFLVEGSNTVFVGSIQPRSNAYDAFTSPAFSVTAPALTASISSTAGASGSTTGTAPIPFTVTFSQAVTGFDASDVTVGNGTITGSSFSGSGTTYTFNVTPSGNGLVTVSVPANAAVDANNTGNTAATQFNITYTQPVVAVAQNVTVQLNANGTATLNASSVNNGSTGAPALTYTIQKVVYGQVGEGQVLTLSTPTGENFSALRFASYGNSSGSNGNYALGNCNASNSAAVVGGILIGNPSGSISADNGTFGDPCGGTPKSLAVVAAYSANAASLPYTCANVTGPNYVLLTVTDGSGTTSTMTAQVTVLAPPPASFTLSPTSGDIGASITASGSNLSGATALTVNGAAATISNLTANGFTFVVPTGATIGAGSVVLTTPCSQSPSATFTVTQPVTAAPVVITPANASRTNNPNITFTGTAPASSQVLLYVAQGGTAVSGSPFSVTAQADGSFSFGPATLPDGTFTVSATAQTVGASVSATSNTNTFTVDTTRPTVVLTSSSGASGSTNVASPFAFTATFSEGVSGFVAGDLSVTNGTVSGFSGPSGGSVYTFTVTPTTRGAVTSVFVFNNSNQDLAGNFNTASNTYSLTSAPPVVMIAPATVPAGTVGAAYSQAITASGATAPYSYAITAGALPVGLTLSSAGVLAGTPTASGTFSFTVTATDASTGAGPYSGARSYSLTIAPQPVTAAPVVTVPANNGFTNDNTPTYLGTAPANSTVTVYADGDAIGTTTADGSGSFSLTQAATLAQGSHTVYATAQTAGSLVSANSNTNTFTVDSVRPTVAISSSAGANNSTTDTAPIPFTVTFSENVTGFVAGDVTVSNGTITGGSISGAGTIYSFTVTPSAGGAVTVNIPANVAQDAAGNGNIAAPQFSITYAPDLVVSTGTADSPESIAAGTYRSITVTADGYAQLDGAVVVTDAVLVQGALLTNCQPLTGDGTFTLAPGATLGICNAAGLSSAPGTGAVQTTGTRAFSTDALYVYNGTVAQVTGNALPATVRELVANSTQGLTLTQPVSIRQRVQLLNDNLDLNGQALTLLSDAEGTALVVNNGGGISGTTGTMQRYIGTNTESSGYRHYSSPVQDETFSTLAAGSYSPNFSGAAAYNGSATPGLVTPFPTVFAYNQDRIPGSPSNYTNFDKGFEAPTSGEQPMEVGRGYAVQAPGNILVDFTGQFTSGVVTRSSLNRSKNAQGTDIGMGWHLLGNPYPSPIDWNTMSIGQSEGDNLQGLNAAVYVVQSSGPYTGTYRTYLAEAPNDETSSPLIPAGQGFFVRTTTAGTPGTLRLTNENRVTEFGAQPSFGRGNDQRSVVRLTLRNAGSTSADKLTLYADASATAGVDARYDATKMSNPSGLNLSAVSATGETLAIDGRPAFTASSAIALRLTVPTAGTYVLNALKVANLPAGLVAYLHDSTTGQQVNLSQQPTTSVTLAAGLSTRYSVVFAQSGALASNPALTAAQVALYPNPASQSASVSVTLPVAVGTRAARATVLNALGQVMSETALAVQAGQASGTISTKGLASGVYVVRLQAGAEVVSKRLIID